MQSNIVKTVEMGHVVILNRVIRVDPGKVAFKKFERGSERGHVYIWLKYRCPLRRCKGPEIEVVPALWQEWLE